jgi:error-prone DNA polymerase
MYIELHTRSAFSFLEGAALPETLAARCAELGMPAIALLDRDGVYGAPRFHLAAKKLGVRAHIGAEVSLAGAGDQVRPPAWRPHQVPQRPVRIALLAESRVGYQNLCRLITCYKLRERAKGEGAATWEELAAHAEGLICLTGGEEGLLASALTRGGYDEARRTLEQLLHLFGPRHIYVEVQRHFDRAEEARNQAAIRLAASLHLPLLATSGARCAHPSERELLDVLTCIRHHCTLANAGRLLVRNHEHHLRSPREMEALFADLPEAIATTEELSARLDFTMANLGYEFPRYPVPAGESMNSFLRQRAEEGLYERYLPKQNAHLLERARRQIERELTLIEKLDLAGYFLIVWDIVQFCRNHGILVQGRGSAANSAVCYALRITAVDPVGMELLFERFLSEERGEWPDIDLDLPSGDQRERAIQYVYQRYGRLGAAMTANLITYRGRSAARETGKVLGFDAETLDRLSGMVSAWEWRDPTDSLAHQFRHAGFELQHARIGKYLELCQRLQDLPRHLGQHSGGMVICQGQLDSVVPLEPASMPGRVVVQWDKEDCADLGIIKVDLLGLGMMAVLEDCEKLVPEHYGEPLDLAQLPPDDPAVYQALQRADTVGMFQVESRAQMSSLPRNSPAKFYDLVVQVAIIRPGPIVGKMMHPYMRRRQGREPVCYPHPSLEPVLQRTLGVPLFQEQLLRIAMIAANFTGGEAEDLRRAMGFKRSAERMREIETKLRLGMRQNGIAPAAQEEIITQITSFALYGFPESHAASFALIAYASAYLKCHYLAAFTAALLNNQPMGFYSTATIVKDAQRHGLRIAPVDVLCSDWRCTLEPGVSKIDPLSLRLGLCYVRGLREEAARAIARERARGAFRNIDDLARRVPELRKPELVTLAEIGALNALGEKVHRRTALWQVERAGRPAGPLLKDLDGETDSSLAAMSHEERLVADFSGTGLTVGPHPMRYVRSQLDAMQVRRACDLPDFRDGENVRIAGCVIARQRPGTARGFIFLSLEDETGIANVIIQPDVYEQNRMIVVREKFLLVEGRLQNQDNVISVKARRVAPLVVTQAATQSHDFH